MDTQEHPEKNLTQTIKPSPRLLAFYLPQYHPVPENNVWWGGGYTEWTNVAQAKPLFPGHNQPRLPADLGYYDLRLPEVREAQADLAREHGVHGFCYYHYWFKGRRLLDRPFQEVLDSGRPGFPFCLCWANHTWTWKRDQSNQGLLIEQQYSEQDDKNHIRWLLGAFQDERYIRVNGRPLMLVWWVNRLPNPQRTFELWRKEAARAGEEEPYICKVDLLGNFEPPHSVGCDAAVESWPGGIEKFVEQATGPEEYYSENRIFEYRQFALSHLSRPAPSFKRFPCVFPDWDNTARHKSTGAMIIRGSTPELYKNWLEAVVRRSTATFEPEEQLIFVNAWNEWGEGTYLEPDYKYGRAYLEATRSALLDSGCELWSRPKDEAEEEKDTAEIASYERLYSDLQRKYEKLQGEFTDYLAAEEYSPRVKKLERHYGSAERQRTQVAREYQALQNKHTQLERKTAMLEEQLLEVAAKNGQVRLGGDDRLLRWLTQLDDGISALLSSRRWEIGNTVAGAIRAVTRRKPQGPTAEDHVKNVLREFRSWSKKS